MVPDRALPFYHHDSTRLSHLSAAGPALFHVFPGKEMPRDVYIVSEFYSGIWPRHLRSTFKLCSTHTHGHLRFPNTTLGSPLILSLEELCVKRRTSRGSYVCWPSSCMSLLHYKFEPHVHRTFSLFQLPVFILGMIALWKGEYEFIFPRKYVPIT